MRPHFSVQMCCAPLPGNLHECHRPFLGSNGFQMHLSSMATNPALAHDVLTAALLAQGTSHCQLSPESQILLIAGQCCAAHHYHARMTGC